MTLPGRGSCPHHLNKCKAHANTFVRFFGEEMVDTLHYQSNLYSTKTNSTCANITQKEMRKYLSTLVISGTVKVPHFRMLWKYGTRFAPVADLMSRNCFKAIHQCLHMNNLEAKALRGTTAFLKCGHL